MLDEKALRDQLIKDVAKKLPDIPRDTVRAVVGEQFPHLLKRALQDRNEGKPPPENIPKQ
jgi:hypothetical protein